MKEKSIIEVDESRPGWEALEAYAREGVRRLLQQLLEEGVSPAFTLDRCPVLSLATRRVTAANIHPDSAATRGTIDRYPLGSPPEYRENPTCFRPNL